MIGVENNNVMRILNIRAYISNAMACKAMDKKKKNS
jgi:hypothetical protein